jgi:hypothetical protein
MHSSPHAVTASPESAARSTSVRSLDLRHLDYPTWHAHIAGVASRTASPHGTGRLERPTEAVRSAAMRPERQAA